MCLFLHIIKTIYYCVYIVNLNIVTEENIKNILSINDRSLNYKKSQINNYISIKMK